MSGAQGEQDGTVSDLAAELADRPWPTAWFDAVETAWWWDQLAKDARGKKDRVADQPTDEQEAAHLLDQERRAEEWEAYVDQQAAEEQWAEYEYWLAEAAYWARVAESMEPLEAVDDHGRQVLAVDGRLGTRSVAYEVRGRLTRLADWAVCAAIELAAYRMAVEGVMHAVSPPLPVLVAIKQALLAEEAA